MPEEISPWLERLVRAVDKPSRPIWMFMALLVVAEFGLPQRAGANAYLLLDLMHLVLLGLLGISVTVAVFTTRVGVLQERGTDLLLFGAALTALGFGDVRAAGLVAILRFVTVGAVTLSRTPTGALVLNHLLSRPALALMLSFSLLIMVGSVLLVTPAALMSHTVDSPLTALFISASATCVTGLSVVDVGSHYSRFGQWVILALIQAGGLGIITITSALALMLRRGLSRRVHSAVQELMETETLEELRTLLVGVVGLTLVLEMAGAAALYPYMEVDGSGDALRPPDRLFFALFHAVSAWCNAGFSLYPDSLIRFAPNVPVNVAVMALVILGGIGATVLLELVRGSWLAHGPALAWDFLSLHTKLALISTAVIIGLGTVMFAGLERTHSMESMGAGTWLMASVFQSVSLRTAGFASVDFTQLSAPTALLSMVFMFIGGSPGGTAGGVKTTTVAVIVLAMRAIIRGRPQLEAFGRSIAPTQVYRAITVVTLSGLLLGALTVALLIVEQDLPVVAVAFEAASAFSTTGHSLGITAQLSPLGQLLVVAMMFIGRVGPFTLALAVGSSARAVDISYPAGRVMVG